MPEGHAPESSVGQDSKSATQNPSGNIGLTRLLARKRSTMTLIMIVERIWPLFLPALSVVAIFLTLSWFGFFRAIPDWLRIASLIAIAGAFCISLLLLNRFRAPRREAVDRRLENNNRILHQAIAAQDDPLEQNGSIPNALWREHRIRLARQIAALETGLPRPDTARHDPYGLRAVVVLALVTSFAFSYSGHSGQLTDAFQSHTTNSAITNIRIDAWVTPPNYTRRAPIFLTQGETALPDIIGIPENSELMVRIIGAIDNENVTLLEDGAIEPIRLSLVDDTGGRSGSNDTSGATQGQGANSARAYRHLASNDALLSISAAGQEMQFQFRVLADQPPKISFTADPRRAVNGALELAYSVNDDYGIDSAMAEIVPAENGSADAVPLYPAPEFPLVLPRRGARAGDGQISHDLTEHPLAGEKVIVTLVATDAAGQTGRSDPREFVLPSRFFQEPLAASVVEQRKTFALDVNQLRRSLSLNDALTIAPEETIDNLSHFLLLRSVRGRMQHAFNEDMLRDAADYMWEVALGIEDGDLSLAERRLRDAQRELAEALENGATDEEIQRLMEELREAMQEFMQALARELQNTDQAQQIPPGAMENLMRQQDLNQMLDQIENLARSGARDQAQQLLSELQRMMNNLQAGRPQQQQGNSQMREQMDQLGELMQQQQQLMDRTFNLDRALRDRMQRGDPQRNNQQSQQGQQQQGQNQQGQNQQGQQNGQQQGENGENGSGGQQPTDQMTADELREALRSLRAQQEALQEQLGQLQQELEAMGIDPGEGFGEAGEAMGDAAGALGEGQGGEAVGDQGRAMQALRNGAQSMMNQMMQSMGEGEGEGQLPGRLGSNDRDPLGRPRSTEGPDFGERVKVPDEIDIQRAREILKEIRRRLGDSLSPDIEKQYLERLLQQR